ncbi:putative glycogen synthase, partial [Toxoplasma gondii VAND]
LPEKCRDLPVVSECPTSLHRIPLRVVWRLSRGFPAALWDLTNFLSRHFRVPIR